MGYEKADTKERRSIETRKEMGRREKMMKRIEKGDGMKQEID